MSPRVLHDELSECLSSEDLYRYIAGELDEDYEIGIEEHLAECEWCRLLLEDIADFTIEQVQHHAQYLENAERPEPSPEAVESVVGESRTNVFAKILEKFKFASEAGIGAAKASGKTYLSKAPGFLFKNPSLQMEWAVVGSAQRGLVRSNASPLESESTPDTRPNYANVILSNGAHVTFEAAQTLIVNVDQWPTEGGKLVVLIIPTAGGETQTMVMNPLNDTDFSIELEVLEGENLVLVGSTTDF